MSGSTKTTKKPVAAGKKPVSALKAASARPAKSKSVAVKKPVKKVSKKVAAITTKSAAAKTRNTPIKKAAHAPVQTAIHHPVHEVKALHMPAAPKVNSFTKTKVNEAWMWVSFFFTFLFIYSVTETVVNLRSGLKGTPTAYAALPALAIAIVVWKANRTKSTYTGMVVVLSMVAAGLFIWLFGVSSGGSSLLFR